MSKTFNVTSTIKTKLVLPEDTLENMRQYIKKQRLPEGLQKYLESLDDERMLIAFIQYGTRQWFKEVLTGQAKADGGKITFAPPHVVVEGKTD